MLFLLSYGVGRTGAYCLLHTMYHQIEREKSVSIYQIARLYNHQRPRCVSTLVRTWNRYFFFFFFFLSKRLRRLVTLQVILCWDGSRMSFEKVRLRTFSKGCWLVGLVSISVTEAYPIFWLKSRVCRCY